MNNTVRVIAEHTKNGVVPLTVLKQKNYPIFRYTIKNYRKVLRMLRENSIEVLNDLSTLNTSSKIRLYLLYYHGPTVDLSLMRTSDRSVYNYLIMRGKPYEMLISYGFEVEYNSKGAESYIIKELYRIADKNNEIVKISDSKLYNRLYYRAKKVGISVTEYIETLGFSYKFTDLVQVKKLKKEGLSFNQISRITGVPRTTLHRLYLQEVGNGVQSSILAESKKGGRENL